MTTTYSDLTNLASILKYVYGAGLTNQFKDEMTTYNQFPVSGLKPAGLGYVGGIRYARTQSVGTRGESKKLPTPLTGQKDQFLILPRYMYGTLKITGPAIEMARGGPASFVESLSDEMDDVYNSLVVQMNRQSHMDGFGKLGATTAAATPSTSTTWSAVFDNIQYFQAGMLVDFFNAAGSAAIITCCGQRVSYVTPSTKTVTFEKSAQTYLTDHPNATIAAYTNDATQIASGVIAVVMGTRAPSWASTDTPFDITGLEGIYDDGTLLASFQNITVATHPKWAANIMSNSSIARELSVDLMLQAIDLARTQSLRKIDTIRMGLGQRRKYVNLLLPDVRFQPTKLRGGYEEASFAAGDGTVSMIIDTMTQPGKMYFEPNGVIEKYELTPLGWGDLDGSKMHRTAGYDEWDLYLRMYTNLGCQQRDCLVKITDLVEPSLY